MFLLREGWRRGVARDFIQLKQPSASLYTSALSSSLPYAEISWVGFAMSAHRCSDDRKHGRSNGCMQSQATR